MSNLGFLLEEGRNGQLSTKYGGKASVNTTLVHSCMGPLLSCKEDQNKYACGAFVCTSAKDGMIGQQQPPC
jgi:hypothetical protein